MSIVSVVSEAACSRLRYHERRGRFLACSITMTSSTSVSSSIVVMLLQSSGLSEELEEADIESEGGGVRHHQ